MNNKIKATLLIMLRVLISILLLITTLGINKKTNCIRTPMQLSINKHIGDAKKIELYKYILYNNNWKSNQKDSLVTLLYPIINPIAEQYSFNYDIDITQLTACVMAIGTSESGNSRGQPFSNILFLQNNNPYGIKGKGISVKTVEYIEYKKIDIVDEFKYFPSLENATVYLLDTLLMSNRYEPVRNSTTIEEFFNNLYMCGYFTNPTWADKYLIPTANYYINFILIKKNLILWKELKY